VKPVEIPQCNHRIPEIIRNRSVARQPLHDRGL
jgi:hypothetical protein